MVKPRENRVPMMLSDAELAAIEDWRFANRVPTRSEAIRRLIRIGLLYDDAAAVVIKNADLAAEHVSAFSNAFLEFLIDQRITPPKNEPMMSSFVELQPTVVELMLKINALSVVAEHYRTGESVESAINQAAKQRAEMEEIYLDLKSRLDSIRSFGNTK
ncbi:hypothetical protein [Neorhizobium galegae]|uniref:Uncharacterized protein n=1 Tax=Neorhizobium galegae bv. officinalis TaxID=323656 RepID=A0A0T7H0N0_NEOGA|nr:hypothetical protein [Neorhizobium galegae]CDZ53059.1 Hypothetical protein NGAL_HAMBI1189_47980 [Neorhizobium galegae bv. officinalis]